MGRESRAWQPFAVNAPYPPASASAAGCARDKKRARSVSSGDCWTGLTNSSEASTARPSELRAGARAPGVRGSRDTSSRQAPRPELARKAPASDCPPCASGCSGWSCSQVRGRRSGSSPGNNGTSAPPPASAGVLAASMGSRRQVGAGSRTRVFWTRQYEEMPIPCRKRRRHPVVRAVAGGSAITPDSASRAGLSSISATPAPASSADATLAADSGSEHVRAPSSAAVVGWMHWKTAAVIASVRAMPAVKQSWKAASRQPRATKRLASRAPLGQRSGRSMPAAAVYITTIETSSRARLKETGLMSSETRQRARTRLYPLKTKAPANSARCAKVPSGMPAMPLDFTAVGT
eukprot:scaffold10304_cov104-Isochrysis_galbana.AAC.2